MATNVQRIVELKNEIHEHLQLVRVAEKASRVNETDKPFSAAELNALSAQINTLAQAVQFLLAGRLADADAFT